MGWPRQKVAQKEEKDAGEILRRQFSGSHSSVIISGNRTPSTTQKIKDSHVTVVINIQFQSCPLYSQVNFCPSQLFVPSLLPKAADRSKVLHIGAAIWVTIVAQEGELPYDYVHLIIKFNIGDSLKMQSGTIHGNFNCTSNILVPKRNGGHIGIYQIIFTQL